MLSIKSPSISLDSSGKLHFARSQSWSSVNPAKFPKNYYEIFLRDLHVQTQYFRSTFDYIHNGKSFDRFGNKACDNVQINGSIMGTVRINGQDANMQITAYGKNSHLTLWSVPPAIRLASTYGYLTQLAPLTLGGWYKASGYSQATVWSHSAIQVGNDWHRFYVHASVAWQSGRGMYSFNVGVTGSYVPSSIMDMVRSLNAIKQAETNGKQVKEGSEDSAVFDCYNAVMTIETFAHVAAYRAPEGSGISYNRTISVSKLEYLTPELSTVQGLIRSVHSLLDQHEWTAYEKSRHAREIIESINDFDSNAIAYASDLRSVGSTVREMLHLGASLDDPKAWAKAWLSYQFGDRLQIADTAELLESIKRSLTHRQLYTKTRKTLRWSSSTGDYRELHSLTSHLVVSNDSYNELMTSIGSLMRWDAWPTLENAWDLVPLSFLVDWIVPVSDLLGQIDAAVESPYLRPITQYCGELYEVTQFYGGGNWSGTLTAKHYKRYRHSVLDDVRPFDWAPSLPSFSVVHAADALALLVQTT